MRNIDCIQKFQNDTSMLPIYFFNIIMFSNITLTEHSCPSDAPQKLILTPQLTLFIKICRLLCSFVHSIATNKSRINTTNSMDDICLLSV